MIAIIAKSHSARLHFACELLFGSVLKVPFKLLHGEEEGAADVRIFYTAAKPERGIWIKPSGFLREKGIRDFNPEMTEWEGMPALFPTQGALPFDLFAAAFFLASRYEEYLPYKGDRFGRFPAEQSFAYRNGFLGEPLIDQWCDLFRKKYLDAAPTLEDKRNYSFLSTIDVDSAFAYRFKGLMRTLGGFARDISGGKGGNMKDRFRAVLGLDSDPFYTYDLMEDWHRKHKVSVVYFFLLADYGLNDKGVSYRSKHLQELIRHLADYHLVGIHPGFQSNTDPLILEREIQRLEQISRKEVELSRQHFLMVRFPDTYRRLITQGIREDYTMGYASQPGFRASTSVPFPFYDLELEQRTTLILHPFAVMDATLNMYQNLSPGAAIEVIHTLNEKVRAVKGSFITLWHNESLSEKWGWGGWREVYRRTLEICSD